jgi:hypothetical protein
VRHRPRPDSPDLRLELTNDHELIIYFADAEEREFGEQAAS